MLLLWLCSAVSLHLPQWVSLYQSPANTATQDLHAVEESSAVFMLPAALLLCLTGVPLIDVKTAL